MEDLVRNRITTCLLDVIILLDKKEISEVIST